MEKYTTKQIRNIALLGHGSSGKTSLAEAMLYISGVSDRLGKVPDGNTVCDYDPEEIKRGYSQSAAIAPVLLKNVKTNVIDTPGYLDFCGEVLQGLRVADSALIVVDGKAGLEVGVELGWDYADEAGLPKSFFINKLDDPETRYDRVLEDLRAKFGVSLCPLVIPTGEADNSLLDLIDMRTFKYDAKGVSSLAETSDAVKERAGIYRAMLLESIAETSEELMEKFFAEEEITRDEAVTAIHEGIINGSIVPVFCGSSTKLWGVVNLLDTIVESFPRHTAKKNEKIIVNGEISDKAIEPDGSPAIFIYKTVADPFVGKMCYFKVMNGELKRDMVLKNTASGVNEKIAHIYTLRGKKQTEVDSLCCGDLGVITKPVNTNTGNTLIMANEGGFTYTSVVYPEPFMVQALKPLAKGDEDKISQGLGRLLEEDYTLKYENNAETKQMLIYGLGDIHLDVVVSKLKTRFGTSVQLTVPKMAYRETIKKKCQVEGKHKKQSGGHGQYGHVKIEFSPGEDPGLTFTETIFGGSVPKNFHPAVEKGLLESMQRGILAGYPMVHLKANLYDGSYHDVDSSEMSFKLAAALAYKEGIKKAGPVILEPIGSLFVTVPDNLVGDVIGDLNKRRGRVMGMNPAENKKGYTVVEAEVPRSEMMDYTISLRAMSAGRGKFVFKFTKYEETPASVAQKIIAEAQSEDKE